MSAVFTLECRRCGDSLISTDADTVWLWGEAHTECRPVETAVAAESPAQVTL